MSSDINSITNRKMTRMALVNWGPYEQPDIIDISDFTLLVGMNGAGKTMSMDAIAFTLYGIKDFNAAAKNDGETRMNRRNLIKIIHGSTRSADRPYLRPDEVISWCIIEFYDRKRGKYFLCGQVSESRDLTSCKTWRFVLDDCRIEDFKFRSDDGSEIYGRGDCLYKGSHVRLDTFQERTNGLKQIAKALGIPGNFAKVSGVIKKTMALRPDADINRFIADSILDEKEGSNEILASLRSMQDNYAAAAAELDRVEKERDALKNANDAADAYLAASRRYTISSMKNSRKKVFDAEAGIRAKEKEKKEKEADRAGIDERIAFLRRRCDVVQDDMMQEYNASGLSSFDTLENKTRNDIERAHADEDVLLSKETDLLRFKTGAKDALSLFGDDPEAGKIAAQLDRNSPDERRDAFRAFEGFKERNIESLRRKKYDAEKQRDSLSCMIADKNKKIKDLENDILSFPKDHAEAKRRLETYFEQKGKNVPVKFAVELIRSVKDIEWQRAVETLIGSRRFNIIVPAEYADEAYGFFKREKIFGVPVVMTNVLKDEEIREGTAAAMLDIINNDARRFFARIIGNVQLADSEQQVKEFAAERKPSITKDGTYSSGHSRSVSRPAEKLYIGKDAVRIQLAEARQQLRALKMKHMGSVRLVKEYSRKTKALDDIYLDYARYDFEAPEKLCAVRQKISSLKKELRELEARTADIRTAYVRKKEELDAVRKDLEREYQKAGAAENAVVSIEEDIRKLEGYRTSSLEDYRVLCDRYPDYEFEIEGEIARARKNDKPFDGASDRTVADNESNMKKALVSMEQLQKICCMMRGEKNLELSSGPDKIPVFRKMFADLDNVRIEECREAVRVQKDRLRMGLIQNFIARLSEQIDNANKEKHKKNRILSRMRFGQQRYQFKIEPCREGAMQLFYKIKEELDSAMSPEALASMLDVDTELNETVLEFLDVILKDIDSTKYTDYRNYLKCDMRIEEDNNMSYDLSTKAGESSNGEKQTPYLIILAVSLCTLYPNSEDVAKVCLMDEAFAAWSGDRIAQMISYFKENGFQVIFAAPDSMFNTVSRYMDTVVTCVKAADSPYAFYCDGSVLKD